MSIREQAYGLVVFPIAVLLGGTLLGFYGAYHTARIFWLEMIGK